MVGIIKDREAALEAIRKKMSARGNKYSRDEHEFRMPKAAADEKVIYYIRVLPELSKGDECSSGICERDYDFFFYDHGAHWIDRNKIECPRLHDNGKCDICQLGFDLLQETSDEEARKEISKKFLPRTYYSLNVYFLDTGKNPEDVRGKVKWMSVPKTIYDIFEACMKNDDPGDDEEPKAFGIFYDVIEGYVFKLMATKKGEWNTYEASQFLANKGTSPLVKSKSGKPNEKGIQEILNQRHDLITKFPDRDQDKIAAITKKLMNGDDDDDTGFDDDEEKPKASKAKPKAKSKAASKPKPKDDDDDLDEAVADDDDLDETVADEATDEVADESPADDEVGDESPAEEEDDEELANLLDSIKSSK